MLKGYFGFTRVPFSKEIDSTEYFAHTGYQELQARLAIMVETRALGLVTGEIGSGKSSAIRRLAAGLDPHRHPVVYCAESRLSPFDFYSIVLEAFGLTPRFQRSQARRQFTTLMMDLYDQQHQVPVLLIDEAQTLPAPMIQELRFITNTQMDALTPFACILVGQPDLRAQLRLRYFEPIQQRIALRYHLSGLYEAETAAYVTHHCQLAGATHPLMAPSALQVLYTQTRGIPRLINLFAVQALWAAASTHADIVDEPHMLQAIADWRDGS